MVGRGTWGPAHEAGAFLLALVLSSGCASPGGKTNRVAQDEHVLERDSWNNGGDDDGGNNPFAPRPRKEINHTQIDRFQVWYPRTPNQPPSDHHVVKIPANATEMYVEIAWFDDFTVPANSRNLQSGYHVSAKWGAHENWITQSVRGGIICCNAGAYREVERVQVVKAPRELPVDVDFTVSGWGDAYIDVIVGNVIPTTSANQTQPQNQTLAR